MRDSSFDFSNSWHGSKPRFATATRAIQAPFSWIAPAMDVLALAAVTAIAFAAANGLSPVLFDRPFALEIPDAVRTRALEFALLSAIALFIFAAHGHYQARLPIWVQTKHVVVTCMLLMLADGFFQYITRDELSRAWVLLGWGFAPVAILTFRAATRGVLSLFGLWVVPTFVVGGGARADETRAAMASAPELGFKVTDGASMDELSYSDEAGETRFDEERLERFRKGFVVIAPEAEETGRADRLSRLLTRMKINFAVAPPFREIPLQGLQVQHFVSHDVTLMTPRQNLDFPLPQLAKRVFDLIVASCALAALSPVFAIIAFVVSRDGGPVFFAHTRIGRHGKPFGCLKFRSMVPNAQEALQAYLAENEEAAKEWSQCFKLTNDPRITRIGAFLRKTSLDELPQLFNVLRGEMSLVGPRPIVRQELEEYYGEDAHFYLQTRPGVTGLWQISGRSDTSYDRRVHLDAWYVRNWTVWHDIAILIRTVPAVLAQKGAR